MQEFQNTNSLDITVSYGKVIIENSNNANCTVDIKGNPNQLKEFKISNTNGNVKLVQNSTNYGSINIGNISIGNNYIQSNGVNVIQSNGEINITGASGNVTINGKKINLSDITSNNPNIENNEPPVIKIKCPKVDCDIELSNIAELSAKLHLSEVNIDLSGTAKAELYLCDSIETNLSGTSELKVAIAEGNLIANTSGCASLLAYGKNSIDSVKANSSGTSSIKTNGLIKGNYKANASGCSKINHNGSIEGNQKQSTNGLGKIYLN